MSAYTVAWETAMKSKVVIHEADEGGFRAEVPSIPGCATQRDSFEELLSNLYEARPKPCQFDRTRPGEPIYVPSPCP